MAIQHFSWGKGGGVGIRFMDKASEPTSTVNLGFTRDGVDLEVKKFWHVIHSDDFGGEAGHPADEQLLGAIVTITTELVKYEKDELDKLECHDPDGTTSSFGGTAGTMPVIGSFMRQDGMYGKLALVGTTKTRTFPVCFPRSKTETIGTKSSVYTVTWEAWMDAVATRVLWTEAENT